jgi:hypothetical protein
MPSISAAKTVFTFDRGTLGGYARGSDGKR